MMRLKALVLTALFGLALGACATGPSADVAACDVGETRLVLDFDAAGGEACTRLGPRAFRLAIAPEARPINPSAWYAFDVETSEAGQVEVTLLYRDAEHRYQPKVRSQDGTWRTLPSQAVEVTQDGERAIVRMDVAAGRTRIAGQEVLDQNERAAWFAGFAADIGVPVTTIGQSVQGRPIDAAFVPSARPGAPVIVIIGGQHPPEVPGVLGLRAFLSTLLGNPDTRAALLSEFAVFIAPELNPDGVAAGHWRLNEGRIDLNRDWGPFTQPETRAVEAAVRGLAQEGHRPVVMLDFHATWRAIHYTAPDGAALTPFDFAAVWRRALAARWAGAQPERSASHNPGRPTSRAWFQNTYGAPSVTVEFADEMDRAELNALAGASALAFGDVMLGYAERGELGE